MPAERSIRTSATPAIGTNAQRLALPVQSVAIGAAFFETDTGHAFVVGVLSGSDPNAPTHQWTQVGGGGGAGFPLTSDVSAAGFRIQNLGAPLVSGDAANRGYVDGLDALALHKAGAETVTGVKTFQALVKMTTQVPAVAGDTGMSTATGRLQGFVGGGPAAYAVLGDIPGSLPPSGAAGGNLAGTYPNPSVVGFALTGNGDAGTHRIVNVDTPVASGDAANKGYVDAVATGLDVKPSATAGTTAALPAATVGGGGNTLTANANGAFPAQDGVASVLANTYLVKDQAAPVQNGIYALTQVGSGGTPWVLTRIAELAAGSHFAAAYTFVQQGTVQAATGWVAAPATPPTDVTATDAMPWTQFSEAGQIVAGAGILKVGNVVSVIYGTGSSTALEGTNDALYAKLAGAQTITGVKTFNALAKMTTQVPLVAGDLGMDAATGRARGFIGGSAQSYATLTDVTTTDALALHKAGAETVTGVKTFQAGAGPLLNNNVALAGKDSGGVSHPLASVAGNVATYGSAAIESTLAAASVLDVEVGGASVARFINPTDPDGGYALRFDNSAALGVPVGVAFRNNADDADGVALYQDGDVLTLGNAQHIFTRINAGRNSGGAGFLEIHGGGATGGDFNIFSATVLPTGAVQAILGGVSPPSTSLSMTAQTTSISMGSNSGTDDAVLGVSGVVTNWNHVGDATFGVLNGSRALKMTSNLQLLWGDSPGQTALFGGTQVIGINTTSGPQLVILPTPTAAGVGCGFWVYDSRGTADVNPITIDPAGGVTIDGALTYTITTRHGGVFVFCDGTGYQTYRPEGTGVSKGWTDNVTSQAGDYAATVDDHTILVTNTAAPRAVTLPAPAGRRLEFRVVDASGGAGANAITVTPAAGTINGAASATITSNRGALVVVSNGTNYFVVARLGTGAP